MKKFEDFINEEEGLNENNSAYKELFDMLTLRVEALRPPLLGLPDAHSVDEIIKCATKIRKMC